MAWSAYQLEQFRHCLRLLGEGLQLEILELPAPPLCLSANDPVPEQQQPPPEPLPEPVSVSVPEPVSVSEPVVVSLPPAPLPVAAKAVLHAVPAAADSSLSAGSFFAGLPWQTDGSRPVHLSISPGQATAQPVTVPPTDNPILAATVQSLQTAQQGGVKPAAPLMCSDFFAGLPWHGGKETPA